MESLVTLEDTLCISGLPAVSVLSNILNCVIQAYNRFIGTDLFDRMWGEADRPNIALAIFFPRSEHFYCNEHLSTPRRPPLRQAPALCGCPTVCIKTV
jgi:hypothetical protein